MIQQINFNIVLYEPLMPHNAGAVVRIAMASACNVYVVGKVNWDLSDKFFKRASVDYYKEVPIFFEKDFSFLKGKKFAFLSSKSEKIYTQIPYEKDLYLIFGSEVYGLPKDFTEKNFGKGYTIPMYNNTRCLNLATSVAIVVYEGLRQLNNW